MSKPQYRYAHQQERKRWAAIVDAGQAWCWRCGTWLPPGCLWDLGHDDIDKTKYRGPECRKCNRGAPRRNAAASRAVPRWVL